MSFESVRKSLCGCYIIPAYIGEIVSAHALNRIVQDTGRNELVLHDTEKLNGIPIVGSKAKITYDANGKGKVDPLIKSKNNGLSR